MSISRSLCGRSTGGCESRRKSRLAIRVVAVLVLVIGAGFVGCDGGGGKRPVKPVVVTVTYKGQPVADATVTFISDDGEPTSAFGKTDAQGIAKPKTPELGDGVVLGKQKILVSKEQILNQKAVASQDSPEYAPLPPGGAPLPVVKDLVPTKYKAPGTTTLTADVTSSGPNDFKLELTD